MSSTSGNLQRFASRSHVSAVQTFVSVQSAAAASVLGALFGEHTAFTDNTHNDRGWGPRRFESFAEAAQEAALSRLYAGIHYRSAVEQGQVQGRCIAARILALRWRE